METNITVIGSANIDYIMQMSNLPKVGETVTEGKFFQTFGGKGANQAVAAARAGGNVSFVGALGNEANASRYRDSLKAERIDCRLVTSEAEVPTGSALIMFDSQGNNYISVAPGANYRVTPERVRAAEAMIAECDWVILQQEIPLETNQAVLALATKHSTPVLLNYAPANDCRLRHDASVHALIVNETEAAALLDQAFEADDRDAVAQVAEALLKRGGHRFVAITLGANGVTLADATGVQHVPAFAVTSADTTAAGDTFCGALAVALGEGKALRDAAQFATAASALSVTKVGAQDSIPTRAAIEDFLKQW